MSSTRFILVLLGFVLPSLPADAAWLLTDTFSYPDGALTNVSSGKWSKFSGAGNDFLVSNGLAQISQARLDDVSALLAGQPYAPGGATHLLYVGLDVIVSSLPSRSGEYFAMFHAGPSGHKGRLCGQTQDAVPGRFRLAVANGSGSPVPFPADLETNAPQRVILRYDVDAASATFWVNPTQETDLSITATDATSPAAISAFAFRQSSSEGVLAIDNLVVATTFAEALEPAPPNPPNLLLHPLGQSVLVQTDFLLSVLAGGDAPLGYRWTKDGTGLTDDGRIIGSASAVVSISHAAEADSGRYQVAVSNASGTVTSSVATVSVVNRLEPPFIVVEPQNINAFMGQSVTLSILATGSIPIACQWRLANTNLPGQTATNLNLAALDYSQAGAYTCLLSNGAGTNVSRAALLTVRPPTLADLHTLVNPNRALVNTTTWFTQRGIVTTWVNLAAGDDALFFMQDETAGLAVFYEGGAASLPPAGAQVEVTARLGQRYGLLELVPAVAEADSRVTILSLNNPLPRPVTLDFDWLADPDLMEGYEGRYMVASNVLLDLNSGSTFLSVSGGELMTDLHGGTFPLYINAGTDIPGAPKLADPVTLYGVLTQYDSSSPYDSGYQFMPTRYLDIVGPFRLPLIRFTNHLSNLLRAGDLVENTWTEQVLRPGETMRLETQSYDVGGLEVQVQPLTNGLPPRARWSLAAASGLTVPAAFEFTPVAADAGSNHVVSLRVGSARGTNLQTWTVYVPTPVEQSIFISEFLANPVSDPHSPAFNPLRRAAPWTNTSLATWDEYLEIANVSPEDVDLWNWSLSDAVGVRHRFYTGGPDETIQASNAIVIYGGPLNGSAPNLAVPCFPASESSAGLALNNTGAEVLLLRNQADRLVDRVCYRGTDLRSGSSLTRFPGLSGGFVPQAFVGPAAVSPGRQYTGTLFSAPPPTLQAVSGVSLSFEPGQTSLKLGWPAAPGQTYTLWQADDVAGPFVIANGGPATNSAGQFIDPAPSPLRRFYFLTTP